MILCAKQKRGTPVESDNRKFFVVTAGKLPKKNGIPWRGNSGLKDGSDLRDVKGGLVGGYYDAGDNIKFHFPMAFSMTLLSWSVVEYSDRYKAPPSLLEHT